MPDYNYQDLQCGYCQTELRARTHQVEKIAEVNSKPCPTCGSAIIPMSLKHISDLWERGHPPDRLLKVRLMELTFCSWQWCKDFEAVHIADTMIWILKEEAKRRRDAQRH
jgi:hypothetical protein